MILSRDRILTTHVGSLPRNEKLSTLLIKREAGEAFDPKEMAAEMDKAVRHVVEKQKAAGIDSGNDGEQQRVGFQTYVPERMTGFARCVKAAARARIRRFSRTRAKPDAALSQRLAPAECTGGAGGNSLQGHQGHRGRDQALQDRRGRRFHARCS